MTAMGSTLVLNEAYEPVCTVSWRKAISKLARGVAEVVARYNDDTVYTNEHDISVYDIARYGKLGRWFDEELLEAGRVRVTLHKPAVIRETSGYWRKPPQFSRINIYLRDNYECQYTDCSTTAQWLKKNGTLCLPPTLLTFDHVQPQSRGGGTNWKNIVTCCRACNNFKDNRTPEEADMTLRKQPVAPKWLPFVKARVSTPDEWRDYLYWNVELT